jgi:hypothetical protein
MLALGQAASPGSRANLLRAREDLHRALEANPLLRRDYGRYLDAANAALGK